MAFAGTVLPSQRDVELSQALFAFPTCGWLLILAERFPTTEIVQKARTPAAGLGFDPERCTGRNELAIVTPTKVHPLVKPEPTKPPAAGEKEKGGPGGTPRFSSPLERLPHPSQKESAKTTNNIEK